MAAATKPAILGRTIADSTPSFYTAPSPPASAPNVVLIVLDDLGFAQFGCFGSDIDTPAIDRMAAEGLRYRSFHVTALCSPTRACLLTGRNHHAVGMGFLTDIPMGFPGYTGRIPKSAATLPSILKDGGYSTMAVGKWHLAPRWEQSASGPFGLWPLGLGFEKHYGFLGGDTNQWTPDLVRDNQFVAQPRSPEEGYHLTEDLADTAIRFIQDQQQATPNKPFFCYFATGAMHAPHQAPRAWIDGYRGHFDQGWDEWRDATFARQIAAGVVPEGTTLTERPSWVAPWHSCSADERRLYARMMEVFAGYLSHTDAQIGRLLSFLEQSGTLDNTLVLILSDNGTSAEGGPNGSLNEHRFTHDLTDDVATMLARIDDFGGHRAYNHYAWPWAWAGNTPFRLWKRYTWLGGVRTPLVVRWPAKIDAEQRGAVRPQFSHAVDVFSTILDAAGVEAPAVVDGVQQQAVAGSSLVPTFTDAGAPSARRTQYFEMLGSRAIYHDGYKAVTDHVGNQLSIERELVDGSHDFDNDRWSLFNLADDFSEAHDLAGDEPELTRQLVDRWWAEAGRNDVLPLDDSLIMRISALEPSPWGMRPTGVFRPGGGPVAEDLLPPLGGGFRFRASITVADDGSAAEGVIAALGDWNNGFALYLLDGCAVMTVNLFGDPVSTRTTAPLAPGEHSLLVEYRREQGGGGPMAIGVDGAPASEPAQVPRDLPFRWQIGGAGLLVGRDAGFPVCDDYAPPFPLTGTLEQLTIESAAFLPPDPDAELAVELHHE
ncbi:MAG: arylsulfatase [Actinobacteria bacterium]|nr:arylsulfatase [Actinomycetota bacterium]